MKRNIFLICPVRNSSPETQKAIESYVEKREAEGANVYWPARDTDQTDPNGWDICSKNFLAILSADEIHVWYDSASTGSKFDLGMVFALFRTGCRKKIIIANPESVHPTPHKSFENVLLKMRETSLQLCRPIDIRPQCRPV